MTDPDRRPSDSVPPDNPAHRPPSAARRGLLVAMPSILSLHSGAAAALARSSNVLVVDTSTTPQPDADGNFRCVEMPAGAEAVSKGWDLGSDGGIETITDIPADRQHYARTGANEAGEHQYTAVNARTMCDEGGDYYYFSDGLQNSYSPLGGNGMSSRSNRGGRNRGRDIRDLGDGVDDGSTKFRVAKGALVSATALASFSGRVQSRWT